MKQNILLTFLFLIVSAVSFGQTVPTSKIIDSKQLLRDLEILSADGMQGRLTGSEGGAKAREYVLQRFKQSDIKPFADNYLQPFEFSARQTQKVKGVNVVGFIKGRKNPEKYIVITAHYDHVGINKGNVFNGADDNASGTSALFAMAKYFSKYQSANSLIFVAFDAEEMGLQGSKYFVANLPVKKEAILLNLNMDMISHNDKNELYATGTFQNPNLKSMLERVQKKSLIKLLLGHDDPKLDSDDWTFQSDQGSFYKEKIPFIYFGVEDHKDYHQPTDDFETINQPFYIHAVETILETVKEFDKNLQKK